MTSTVSLLPLAGTARTSAPSLGALAGIEIRKSLSTRSGKALGIAAMLLGPVGMGLAGLVDDGAVPASSILGLAGMLTALVLLALGVLSTAGEWTHKSIQVTFLLVPQRLRVLTAKGLAVAAQGAVIAAMGTALSAAVLWLLPDAVDWSGSGRAIGVAVAGGAAFAVIGAGIGAALGNSAAALTGTFLVMLGVLPILATFQPGLAANLDPTNSLVTLAEEGLTAQPLLVVAGWLVVSAVVGAVITRRRSVQ